MNMRRVLWVWVSLLALASPAWAQPEVDASRLHLGPSASPCVFSQGAASPEGAVTGSVCDLYLQTTTSPSLWVKSTGTNSTTLWLKMVLPGSGAGLVGAQYCVPYLTATDTQGCYSGFTFDGAGNLSLYGATSAATSISGDTGAGVNMRAAGGGTPTQNLYTSRGTIASKTTTTTGDLTGALYFWGRASNSVDATSAAIEAHSSGTIAASKVPGELRFRTASDSSGTLTTRLYINNAGALAFTAGSYGTAGQIPQSAGSGSAVAWTTATYPGTVTANQILFGTATNVVGQSANLTYSGGILTALATDGRHEVDPLGSFIYRHSNTAAASPDISLQRSRGTTSGTAAAVDVDDSLGAVRFRGHDGTGYIVGASIEAVIEDTVATNDLATGLRFSTTPIGSATPVERLRINQEGNASFYRDISYAVLSIDGDSIDAILAHDDPPEAPLWRSSRSRGTVDTPTDVSDGDLLGAFVFRGYAGENFEAARIEAVVSGTPDENMPGALVFSTTPAAGEGPVESLRIAPTGMASFALGITNVGAAYLTGVISPTQLTANTDNWGPTDLDVANVIRVNVDAARNITGIVAQADGRMILLHNTTAFTITLVHNATSTAANRFYLPGAANFSLTAYSSRWIRYDGTHGRWTIA